MKNLLAVVCILAYIIGSLSQNPDKPVWPNEFDIPFGLNVPEGANDSYPAIINATSHFYYNWDYNESSLIVYDVHCLPGIFPLSYDFRCHLYFNTQGAYIYFPAIAMCCLAFPGISSLPPDFLRGFNYSGYDQIAFNYYGVPFLTNYWIGGGGFMYWTALNKFGSDIALDDGGGLLWNFGEMNVTSQSQSMFDLPHSYCNLKCPTESIDITAMMQDPMLKLSSVRADFEKQQALQKSKKPISF